MGDTVAGWEPTFWAEARRYGLWAGVVIVAAGLGCVALSSPPASGLSVVEGDDPVLLDLPPLPPSSSPSQESPEGPASREAAAAPPAEPVKSAPVPERPPPEVPRADARIETAKETPRDPAPMSAPPSEATAPAGATVPVPKADPIASEGSDTARRHLVSRWQRAMIGRLEQAKLRSGVRIERTETVEVAFSIDREGRLRSSRIMRGSGSAALDRAALTLIQRAQPFPKVPPEVGDGDLSFTVPIVFARRGP